MRKGQIERNTRIKIRPARGNFTIACLAAVYLGGPRELSLGQRFSSSGRLQKFPAIVAKWGFRKSGSKVSKHYDYVEQAELISRSLFAILAYLARNVILPHANSLAKTQRALRMAQSSAKRALSLTWVGRASTEGRRRLCSASSRSAW